MQIQTGEWTIPSVADVLTARRQIRPYLQPTPLYHYLSLSRLVGCSIWVKHENHLPTGAFKVRGGVNLVSQLPAEERSRGLIAASSGNHGQSVAYGARLFGAQAHICIPEKANPTKVEAMKDLGAEIIVHGRDFDAAREHCEQLASERRYRYVHSGNEPLLIAGVATATLEILEARPEAEILVVPLGGGSGAAGACIVAKAIRPGIQVIAVQSDAAPAGFRSWKARKLLEDKMETWADGLQTRTAFELPQQILWDQLDDFVLVSDEEIRTAARLMIEKTRNLVEGASAATLAAALNLRNRLAGKEVVLMCTGGNLSLDQLRQVTRNTDG